MTVQRIVANIACPDPARARSFYGALLGMEVVMDQGWILTFATDVMMHPQVSVASEGGSGAPVPDISIEVDNLDDIYHRVLEAGVHVEYGPVSEPWRVRRFFVRDPCGRLVNILAHA